MKLNLIVAFFVCIGLASCETREQKVDTAFEQVKEEKMLNKDTVELQKALITESVKPEPVVKAERPINETGLPSLDEWSKFRIETEKKIVINEERIKKIHDLPNAGVKLFKRVASLERDNNDLRIKMEEYKSEEKSKWENFKLRMSEDMSDIDMGLKEIALDIKK